MAPRAKSLAEKIAELNNPAQPDYDPEDINLLDRDPNASSDNDSSDDDDGTGRRGREHYEEVGKSNLRKPTDVALGRDYGGAKVGRKQLEESEDDDPFSRGFEDEDSSENESDSDVPEGDKSDNDNDDSMDVEIEDMRSEDEDEDGDEDNESDQENEESEDDDEDDDNEGKARVNRDELKKLMAQDQKAVTSSLSQATKTDVAKGNAIKHQRSAFDSTLNMRIKLQKALVSTNSLALPANDKSSRDSQEVQAALESAEAAAVKLWNTLDAIKMSLFEARTDKKRKHLEIESNTPLESVWSHMEDYETDLKRQRNSNLDFWSSKTRVTTNATQGRRLNNSAPQQTLSDVLASQLADMPRLVGKTQVPRSCAPQQAAALQQKKRPVDEEEGGHSLPIYDDADFYGPLLQALVAQRSSDAAALSAMSVSFASQPWQAAREAKTKKMVDTKASKGRKLRYTVHEKLQNLMAPDNRAVWSERQCDELFASLQGRTVALRDDESDEEDIGGKEMESLRLFASN